MYSNLILNYSLMWFLFVRPEICLHLPSDSTSRWTPLVFGCILPTTRADWGLSPVRNVRRKAHCNKSCHIIMQQLLLFFDLTPYFQILNTEISDFNSCMLSPSTSAVLFKFSTLVRSLPAISLTFSALSAVSSMILEIF